MNPARLLVPVLVLVSGASLFAQKTIGLEEAVAMALEGSADLRISRLRSQTAARAFSLGIRDFLPQLGVSANDARSVALNAPDTASKSWSVTLAQPLYQGGRRTVARALSRMELALENRRGLDRRDELSDAVRAVYYKILVQREQQRIQRDIRDIAQRQLEIARTERAIGAVLEIDLLDAELEAGSIELELQDTVIQLEESMFQFRRLLGLEPDASVELSGAIDDGYLGIDIPANIEFFYAIGRERNSELASQELEIQRLAQELKNANSWFVPNISLEVTLSASGERYPLQTFSTTGKLAVEFPIRSFPFSTSLSLGTTPGSEMSAGSSASLGVLRDVGVVTDRNLASLSHESALVKRSELLEDLRFQITKAITGHAQEQRGLALKRGLIDILTRKIAIMTRQLDLGEVKRVDFMKLQTQLAREQTSLLEDVLSLLESERAFERLLGAQAGELTELCRRASARSSQ